MAEVPFPAQLRTALRPKIINFKDNIFLLQVGLTIFAFKHNYLMQELTFNNSKNGFLMILQSDQLVHFDRTTFDHYFLSLDESHRP